MRVGGRAANPPPAGSGAAVRADSCCRTVERLEGGQQGAAESKEINDYQGKASSEEDLT